MGVLLASGVLLGRWLAKTYPSDEAVILSETSRSNHLNKAKLSKLIDYIEYEYVDDVNTDSITDLTVNSILAKLDPHSTYISKENMQDIAESMNGRFVGVGIHFYMYKDTLAVIRSVEGSDAAAKGIRLGDRILNANNDTIFGKRLTSDAIRNILKGDIGSSVQLTVYRKETDSVFTVDVERRNIPIKSVDAYYMVNDTTAYLRINRFAETTHSEFTEAIKALKKEKFTTILLDLRNNTGGFLTKGIEIADEFLPEGERIVFTKNNKGEIKNSYATEGGLLENETVFVLVNEQSASASEIVAGALQDNDRGTIIGRRTFGKGLIQSEMPLPDGSVVRLTTARYYTPTGRSIQKPYSEYQKDKLHERIKNNNPVSADSINVKDSLKFTTPKGKIVYGGGGIIPDIFVPMNVQPDDFMTSEVLKSGLVNFFLFEYLDTHPHLQKPDLKSFVEDFEISKEMADSFSKFLENRRIFINPDLYFDDINKSLKVSLAEIWFDDNVAARIRNEDDPFFLIEQ